MKKREPAFDLLRFICAVGVILIHVSSFWYEKGETGIVSLLPYAFPRFAVPVFVLISGAFILGDARNGDFGYFYRKAAKRLFLPTLTFSAIYFVYGFLREGVLTVFGGAELDITKPVRDLLLGAPFYHLWFLFMLSGVYILVPAVIAVKEKAGEKKFLAASPFLFAVCLVSGWTSSYRLGYDAGQIFVFTGYFIMGYYIKKRIPEEKSNKRGVLFIVLGALFAVCTVLGEKYLGQNFLSVSFTDPFCPTNAISAILIFAGFASLDMKKDMSFLGAVSFPIYLLHAGIWDIVLVILSVAEFSPGAVTIPIFSAAVFALSFAAGDMLVKRKVF